MLDKKLCQRHADPGLELDPDSGVLYAQGLGPEEDERFRCAVTLGELPGTPAQ